MWTMLKAIYKFCWKPFNFNYVAHYYIVLIFYNIEWRETKIIATGGGQFSQFNFTHFWRSIRLDILACTTMWSKLLNCSSSGKCIIHHNHEKRECTIRTCNLFLTGGMRYQLFERSSSTFCMTDLFSNTRWTYQFTYSPPPKLCAMLQ